MSPDATSSVSSGVDLMASVPSDLFSSAGTEDTGGEFDANESDATDDGALDVPDDAPGDGPPVEDDAPADEEPTAEEDAPPVEEKSAEDLPEGVKRGKDRNGKEGLFVTPQRWDNIYGNHQLVQKAAEMLGEPLTAEGLDLRQRAYLGQEKLYGDLLSGDPQAQASVLQHFLQEGARAVREGEVGVDPTVSLAQAMYSTMRDGHPDAYANLRMQAAKDLVEELYQEAGQGGNKNLWLSIGHIADALKLPYRKTDEFATFAQRQSDPLTALQRRNQELEQIVSGRQANNQAAQFDTWREGTKQTVKTALLETAIKPALADTQKAWEKFPEAFKDLVLDRLHSAVQNTIRNDQRFNEHMAHLTTLAKRATSAQKRGEIGEQIKQAHINRATLAVEGHLPKIRQDAARIFKERSDANIARRQAAPNRGPKGASAPANQSRIPAGVGQVGGQFSLGQAEADLKRLFQ